MIPPDSLDLERAKVVRPAVRRQTLPHGQILTSVAAQRDLERALADAIEDWRHNWAWRHTERWPSASPLVREIMRIVADALWRDG